MTPAEIDRVFGRGRLRMATGEHVEVVREAALPGHACRYTKRFVATPAGDFGPWTERERRILERLGAHAGAPVARLAAASAALDAGKRRLQTEDAGPTVDQWATLVPLRRGDISLANVFEDCAFWWALAGQSLRALDTLHALGFVHLDLKADNVCIPWADQVGRDPAPGRPLMPRFEGLALIDVAFSVLPDVPFPQPLPLALQPDYEYQSPRLLEFCEQGRHDDEAALQHLDWRCDFFSLAAMLWHYLPEAEHDSGRGWTAPRHAHATALVRLLLSIHGAALPTRRPHAALIELTTQRLREPGLAAALQAVCTFDPDRVIRSGAEPTPPTRMVFRAISKPEEPKVADRPMEDAVAAPTSAPAAAPDVRPLVAEPAAIAPAAASAVAASIVPAGQAVPESAPALASAMEAPVATDVVASDVVASEVPMVAAPDVPAMHEPVVSNVAAFDEPVAPTPDVPAMHAPVVSDLAASDVPAVPAPATPAIQTDVTSDVPASDVPMVPASVVFDVPASIVQAVAAPPAVVIAAVPVVAMLEATAPAELKVAAPVPPAVEAPIAPPPPVPELPAIAAPVVPTMAAPMEPATVAPVASPLLPPATPRSAPAAVGQATTPVEPVVIEPVVIEPTVETVDVPMQHPVVEEAQEPVPVAVPRMAQPPLETRIEPVLIQLPTSTPPALPPILESFPADSSLPGHFEPAPSAARPRKRLPSSTTMTAVAVAITILFVAGTAWWALDALVTQGAQAARAKLAARSASVGSSKADQATSPARQPRPAVLAPSVTVAAATTPRTVPTPVQSVTAAAPQTAKPIAAPVRAASAVAPAASALAAAVPPRTVPVPPAAASAPGAAQIQGPLVRGATAPPPPAATPLRPATSTAPASAPTARAAASSSAASSATALAMQAAPKSPAPSSSESPRVASAETPVNAKAPNADQGPAPAGDLNAIAAQLMRSQIPKIAQGAERQIAPVLAAAAPARALPAARVRAAAQVARASAKQPPLRIAANSQQARSLNEAARLAYWRGNNVPEAVSLETRAFGANPLDAEVVGNLAFLRLRERPPQAEPARQLALHALTLKDKRFPTGRIEDWTTFAIASALTGREADARNAWFVTMALSNDLQRHCNAAVRAQEIYGERLRPSVQAMLQRARASGEYGRCTGSSRQHASR